MKFRKQSKIVQHKVLEEGKFITFSLQVFDMTYKIMSTQHKYVIKNKQFNYHPPSIGKYHMAFQTIIPSSATILRLQSFTKQTLSCVSNSHGTSKENDIYFFVGVFRVFDLL